LSSVIIKKFETLYGKASNGKVKTVEYTIIEDTASGICTICNSFGYLDGKKQVSKNEITSGKNIDKSNETSIKEQAILEARSKWRKKLDSNYTTNIDGIPSISEKSLLPMLVHNFRKRSHNIIYPCMVQPKLNGLRNLSRLEDKEVINTSRKFKVYDTLKHIEKELYPIMKNSTDTIFDGEVYLHGLTLEEINRRVKKYRGDDTVELEYWIYDIANSSKTFKERNSLLHKLIPIDFSHIKILPTFIANNKKEVLEYHDKFVQQGYEGVIIRNIEGLYLFEKRSPDVQKYKEFIDDEFEVVGTKAGTGSESGAIIFTCKVINPLNGHKGTFDVRPRGKISKRIQMYTYKETFIGKKLTVRYQELSENNIPTFPVGITFRLKQDLP